VASDYVTHRELEALRTEMNAGFTLLRAEMVEFRGEVRGEIGDLRGEFASQTRTLIYANFGAMLGLAGIILTAPRLT